MKTFKNFFFLQISLIWIIVNFLMSIQSLSSITTLFLVIRDSWVLTFILLLFFEQKKKIIISLFVCLILGVLPLVYQVNIFQFKILLYGVRDICLIFLIIYMLSSEMCVNPRYIKVIFYIMIFGALLQLSIQYISGDALFDQIANPDVYYGSKGIESNSSGGILGKRVYFPLYSSSLIGTFLALYFFLTTNKLSKFLSFVISFLTFSKACLIIFFFYSLNRYRNSILFFSVIGVFFLPPLLLSIIENTEQGIITYHFSSIMDRFNAFEYLKSSFINMPDYIGYNTVAGYVLSGRDAAFASESLFISHIIDYKFFIFLILPMFIYLLNSLKKEIKKNLYPIFFILLFSSMSNHPIAFLPLILFNSKTLTKQTIN